MFQNITTLIQYVKISLPVFGRKILGAWKFSHKIDESFESWQDIDDFDPNDRVVDRVRSYASSEVDL